MNAPKVDAENALRAGDPRAALKHLSEAVRGAPADARLRIFLAQLLCVLGQWERAHTQLNVAAELDKAAIAMREVVGHAIRFELLRAQVFAGKRQPMVFGPPTAWVASLIESLTQQDNEALAASLAQRAFDEAPARSGAIDGTPFAWIADADSRLGPVLEACINGHYCWVPLEHLTRMSFEAPQDLRDCVWTPAQLHFANGGQTVAFVPTRYPGSERSDDGFICLSRKTQWREATENRWFGLGQRVLTTDLGDHDLMVVREIVFDTAVAGEVSTAEG